MSDPQRRIYMGDSRISSAERDVVLGQPATTLKVADVLEMAQSAKRIHARFREWIQPRMSEERARRIQQLRCGEEFGWSYRAIAGLSYLEWGPDATWKPLNHQLAGLALCEAAAEVLGQDAHAWPWQGNQA